MGTITNRIGLEKPVVTDQFSTATIAANWQALDDQVVLFLQNIRANRPAAGKAGRVFTATDTAETFYDTGTDWLRVPTAAPTGAHLFEKGTSTAPGISFSSDTNTGVASLGADRLDFVTGGRAHWRVDAVGELGGRNFTSNTATAMATQKAGQSHPYWTSRVDGLMQWGSGGAAPDVTLYRDQSSRLRVTGGLNLTGDVWVGGHIRDGGTGDIVLNFDGNTVIIGQDANGVRHPYGDVSTPGISFNGDANTGFYRAVNGATCWSGNGVYGGLLWGGGVRVTQGSLTSPSLSFDNDTNSGLYSGGDGNVRVVANSTIRLEVAGSRTTCFSSQFRAPNGTQASPGLQFDDPDTGFYHLTSLNQVGLAIDGNREFLFGQTGSYIDNVWNSTTTSGSANVVVSEDGGGKGRLRRFTSQRAHKANIASILKREHKVGEQGTLYDRGKRLNPISYTSRLSGDDKDQVVLGLIAEEVADTVPELAVYGYDGSIQSVAYDRVSVLALTYALDALRKVEEMQS